jgi:cholesterol oxidase
VSAPPRYDCDWVVVGSGFGGSVAALRLAEKGYRVVVLEQGRRFDPADFPKTNWDLPNWLWLPQLRWHGFFRMSLFRHLLVLSGTGVGGGSLVYSNTLPIPKPEFFAAPGWAHLADWERELAPHYETARQMLGTTLNPRLETGDRALADLAARRGIAERFEPTEVAVFFGEPDVEVPDPYFDGRGPARTGCTFCGACMTGCRYGAKNTLDRNYLWLAEGLGVEIRARTRVTDLEPVDGPEGDGGEGWRVNWRDSTSLLPRRGRLVCRGVVLAGGVLGTVPLLLRLRRTRLPRLSVRVGHRVRTNSESLLGVTAMRKETVFSEGIAIGSILNTDPHSNLEPVRYASGSGFWRILASPLTHGPNALVRVLRALAGLVRHPVRNLKALLVRDWAKHTQILLYMRTIDSTLRLRRSWWGGLRTTMEEGARPEALMSEARELAREFAAIVDGQPMALLTETVLGIPNTAHILGGCVMGRDPAEGVIDHQHRVFGYRGLLVCDGSTVSANPGVNPSLTITALSERAMTFIPPHSNPG